MQKVLGDDMDYKIIDKKVLSSNAQNYLVGKIYLPEKDIKGYFHIVHGKTEHIARYDSFMRTMAEEGYITFAYDHLGHGYTAVDDTHLGFIADKGGDDILARDVKVFADAVRAEYGDHPYYLLGHSMGSFVVRMATQKYITPDKLIIMGTGGPMPIVVFGLYLSKLIRAVRGPRHISPLVDFLAFGTYNSKFTEEEGPHAWLTKDKDIRDKYAADKFCTFPFTVSAMHDLISLTHDANKNTWFESVAKKTPILLVSGEDDVVGKFGKGVKEVHKKLLANGADVKMKLYHNNRHEILNDSARGEVIADIIEFIQQ